MSAQASSHALRRAELVARMDRERNDVENAFDELRGRSKVAEAVVSVVRRANQHRVLAGTLAVFAILAPFAARTWLKRAAWLLPLAIEGVRLMRSRRDDTRD